MTNEKRELLGARSYETGRSTRSGSLESGYVLGLVCAFLIPIGGLKATPLLAWAPIDLTLLLVLLIVALAFRTRAASTDSVIAPLIPVAICFACLSPGILTATGSLKLFYVFIFSPILIGVGLRLGNSRAGVRGLIDGSIGAATLVAFGIFAFPNTLAAAERASIVGANPIDSTRALIFGVICLVARVSLSRTRVGALVIALPVGFVFVLFAVQTGSRGPWVGLVVGAVGLIVFSRRRLRASLVLGAFGLSAGVILSAVIAESGQSGIPVLDRIFRQESNADLSTGRDAIASVAIQGIRENPLGIGWGSFGEFSSAYGIAATSYAHNIFLEIGVESGLIGLAGFIILISAVLIFGLKSIGEPAVAFVMVSFTYWLVCALFSSDFGGNRGLWISVGLVLGVHARSAWAQNLGGDNKAPGARL